MRSLTDLPETDRIALAQTFNDQNLPWTAMAYTQVDMERLGEKQTFGFAQVRSFGQSSDFADILREAQQYLEDPDAIQTLESEFDWSNFRGEDFTGPVRDQGSCGSCYMVATNTMLESRIKLWYGKERELSTQMPMQCNFLTEGCHGGWGLLYGYFLESYYTVAENKAPYSAKTEDDGCKRFKNAPKVAGVEATYYVGGAYGLMTEENLMKEIRARGPVLYDFNAGGDFMTYNSGILMEMNNLPAGTETEEELADRSIHTESQEDAGIQYQKLTHSTLVIGWGVGEDQFGDPVNYWKVRNSYGKNWGDHGYFYVRRGHNDYGGEGENSAHIPICYDCGTRGD